MKKTVLLTLALLSVIIVTSCGGRSNKTDNNVDDRGYVVNAGDEAPDFTTLLMDSTTFKLSDQRGKVVMLQFTASWCGVCRKEMPHIESDVWLPLKDKGLVLVGIDRGEPIEKVIEFAQKMEITYPLALDEGSEIFTLYARTDAGVTRNVIVDKEGTIAFQTRLFNEDEFKEMIEVIKELLEK